MLILSAIGLTIIIKYSYILKIPRAYLQDNFIIFKEFFNCCMCIGFWAGLIIYYIQQCLFYGIIILSAQIIFDAILFGFIISILSYITDLIIDYIDNKVYEIELKNDKGQKNGKNKM